jgi:hypothetical protein
MKPENMVLFERSAYDFNRYWLHNDSLHNVDYDMFFSPFKKYTCQAGCKVCYISKELDVSAAVMNQYAPVEITEEQEAIWKFWFDQFDIVGYSDDLLYIKLNFPHVYQWLTTNGHRFEYCMTDNAVLRQHNILMSEIKFSAIMDISISDSFLDTHPDMWNKVHSRLEELNSRYELKQIKFLITKSGPHSRTIAELIKWVDSKGLQYLIHHDFTDEDNLKHEVAKATNYNDWVMCQSGRLFEIQKETVQLFGDRWFFSSQDATSRDPFWIMDPADCYNLETLLFNILLGKQHNYSKMKQELDSSNKLAQQFSAYFAIPGTYTVNKDYNFIPNMLVNTNSRFISNLLEQGWINTTLGLYKPGSDHVRSILEPNRTQGE